MSDLRKGFKQSDTLQNICNNNDKIMIANRFILDRLLSKGSFGEVYLGYDKQSNNFVAIKLENIKNKDTSKIMLKHEFNIYNELMKKRTLNDNIRIPKIYWYNIEDDYAVLVIELLDSSLENLFNNCNRVFSLKTVLMIGIQIFDQIEYMHKCSYIHRDLKPENFLIGMILGWENVLKIRTMFIVN